MEATHHRRQVEDLVVKVCDLRIVLRLNAPVMHFSRAAQRNPHAAPHTYIWGDLSIDQKPPLNPSENIILSEIFLHFVLRFIMLLTWNIEHNIFVSVANAGGTYLFYNSSVGFDNNLTFVFWARMTHFHIILKEEQMIYFNTRQFMFSAFAIFPLLYSYIFYMLCSGSHSCSYQVLFSVSVSWSYDGPMNSTSSMYI